MIINQLLPIALFIAIPSFKAADLMQLLGISGAAIPGNSFRVPRHPRKLAGWDFDSFARPCIRIQAPDSCRQ
ncbi:MULTISPECIES: hypothetical protein [unclassified Microcoleus]|uniref:hypothetical protein n=1 Tax=unclassified Microcoleus TaxID=2642155 RepID=UPI002FD2E10F